MIPRRAMVFAAGYGRRLRPLTDRIPKPLVAVGGRTMLDRALDLLESAGVEEAVVNAAHLREQIVAHLASRTSPRIHLSLEDEPLETGGGIRQAFDHLKAAPFFALNSDVVIVPKDKHPLLALAEAFDERLDALLLLHPTEQACGYEGKGDFFLRPDGGLRFRGDEASAPYVFTGAQILHPRLFAAAPDGPYSLNVLYRRLCAEPGMPRIGAVIHDGDWLHVGDPDGLAQAEAYFA